MGFKDYTGTYFASFLLPIIPKGAALGSGSKLTPEKIGKIPGFRKEDGTWIGYAGFTHRTVDERVFPAWARMFELEGRVETIGMQGAEFPAVDMDADEASVKEIVERNQFLYLGAAPKRYRIGTHKFLSIYRLKPDAPFIRKRRLAFTDEAGAVYAIEVLGHGQQYVIEGEHPSGTLYQYDDGDRPLDWGPEGLTPITNKDVDAFLAACRHNLEERGFTALKPVGTMRGSSDLTRYPIETHPDQCPDFGMLIDWLQHCRNDSPDFRSRDAWIRAFAALKAATAGDESFYVEHIEPWCLQYADNTQDYVRDKWESINDAALGWSYLVDIGYELGWKGAAAALFDELPVDEEHPAHPSPGIGIEEDAIALAFAEHNARKEWIFVLGQTRRVGGGWRHCVDGIWQDDDTLFHSVGNMCRRVSKLLLAKIPEDASAEEIKKRKSTASSFRTYKKQRDITSLVQKVPAMRVHKDELDADPLILGVPGGYIAPDGKLRPPDPALLITKRMLVAPDVTGSCPQFLRQLSIICNNDPELVLAMQRFIGYTLTGFGHEQVYIFLHGEGGTGKTHFVKTISDLMGDYATRAENTTFAQLRMDRRSFDLSDLEGYRMCSMSEINKGMEWDEARLKEATGGDGMRVEAKNMDGRFLRTPPVLWFTGNRVPKFSEGGVALERRILLFNTLTVFDQSTIIKDFAGMVVKSEGGPIVAHLVRWRQDYLQHGLYVPQKLISNRRSYFNENDKTISFLVDEAEFNPVLFVLKAEVYDRYRHWCGATGHRAEGRNDFYSRLETCSMFREKGCTFGRKRLGMARDEHPQQVVIGMQIVPPARSTVMTP